MLGKLAFRNARRSFRDYLVYLITITLSFSLIFAFNLVAQSDEVTFLAEGMSAFRTMLLFVNAVIVFVICFLINYTTKFMLEKRSRELGIYMLLGIRKGSITKMFVGENLILGCFALLLSLPAGFVMSQFFSFVIAWIFDIPKAIFVSLDLPSIGLLVLYFAAVYLLVLLNMLRKIRKMTVHKFLYLEQQNEEKMFQSRGKRNVLFLAGFSIGAAALIIWHIYTLDMETALSQGTFYLLFGGVIALIVSMYICSATASDMLLSFVLKSRNRKYSRDNLFVARTFASKARTMGFTLGTLSALILLSLLAFNLSSYMKGMYDAIVDQETPYDVTVMDDREAFDEYLSVIEEDYTIDETVAYDIYKDPQRQVDSYFSMFTKWDSVLKLSDYNRLLALRSMAPVSMGENEYLITCIAGSEAVLNGKKEVQKIQGPDGSRLKLKEITTKTFWITMCQESDCVLVLPDSCAEGLEIAESHLLVNLQEEDTTGDLETKLQERMSHHLCVPGDDGDINCQYYRVRTRGSAMEGQLTLTAMIASLCLYMAFIFISVVGTIVAIQSLSDSTKYRYRYLTLRKLGVNDRRLYKTVRKQLLILFGLPVLCPLVIGFFLLTYINRIYAMFLDSRFTYLLYFAGAFGLFLLIYALYFAVTYIGFKRNINEPT